MITLLHQEKNKFLTIASLLFVLLFLQNFQHALLFDHEKISDGEYWRLISGNLVHINLPHLVMNSLGTLLLLFLFKEHINNLELIIFLLLAATSIGIGLYFFSPDIQRYTGFSGILYGCFFYLASLSIYRKNYHYGIPVVIVLCGKTIYEALRDTPKPSNQLLVDIPVAIDAHIYGLFCGLMYFLALVLIKRNAKSH